MERSPGKNFQVLKASELRDIGMGEFDLAFDDKQLVTIAASTCIIVAAYNTQTGFRMLGHFSDIAGASKYSDGEEFDSGIEALQDLGDPNHTKIELHGGGPLFINEIDTVTVDRLRAVESIIKRYPEAALSEIWLPENRCVDVSVDQSGQILAFTYPK